MEDADSVLVTSHQYRTGNRYMVSFIEDTDGCCLHSFGTALSRYFHIGTSANWQRLASI